MNVASGGAEVAITTPCEILLEIVRARKAGDPFAFVLEAQSYNRHDRGGKIADAELPWGQEVLDRLAAVQKEAADAGAAAWLGEVMRRFLVGLGWELDEERIRAALDAGRPAHLTLRLGAAELFALPWELVPLGATGRPLGALPGCMLRYEWPATETAKPDPDPPPEGGRILFAWSAAGGLVPAQEHLAAIGRACRAGPYRGSPYPGFDRERDVVPRASLDRLQEALRERPTAVLHLLCHGAALDAEGASYGLVLDADEGSGEGKALVDAGKLRDALADHLGSLRLVVLCACHGADPGALDSRLGSVAQALHRVGVPAVVASRYPLSVDASVELSEALYQQLLVHAASLEQAFLAARDRLRERPGRGGWSALQLYARAADGPDHRPIVHRPYRGLLAFREEHERFFFGREDEVAEAIRDLTALMEPGGEARARFLVIAGASGTGKSSLVPAGIVPALRRRDSRWVTALMRPRQDFRAALDDALRRREDPTAPLLIVVDQFEEIFTTIADPAARAAFAGELWRLAGEAGSGVSVIVTLRVDFLARCGEISLGAGGRRLEDVAYDEAHRVFLRRMRPEHLRRIIEEPARRVGLSLEEGLVEQMLKDAGDEPGALPLLQYTLDRLWERRRGRALTWEEYNQLGGVGGALEKRADAIIAGLDKVRQRAARRLLVQLVAVDSDARFDRRRRLPVGRLRRGPRAEAKVFDEVLDTLVREHLLALTEGDKAGGAARSGSAIVEVAHEELVRRWGALRGWAREDLKWLMMLEQLDRWVDESRRFPNYRLEGERLRHAHDLLGQYAEDISEAARELVHESERWARRKRLRALAPWIAAVAVAICASAVAARMLGRSAASYVVQLLGARDVSLAVSARYFLARNRPGPAAELLSHVSDPAGLEGWTDLAHETLTQATSRVVLGGHEREVLSAAWSPDGRRVVTTSSDRTARVWSLDAPSGPIVLEGHLGEVLSAAWSPDGRRVVTTSSDRTARVWSPGAPGNPLVLKGHQGKVLSAAWSHGGARIVTTSSDGTARVWSADGAGEPVILRDPDGAILSAAWSPDDERIVTTSEGHTARVWDGDARGEPLVLRNPRAVMFIDAAAWSPGGDRVVTVSRDLGVYAWSAEPADEEPLLLAPYLGSVTSIALSDGGDRLAIAAADGTVHVIRLRSDDASASALAGHTDRITSVAFSPDGRRVATASSDGTARVWNADGTSPTILSGHEAAVLAAAWSPDGQRVVTASEDGTARIWIISGSGGYDPGDRAAATVEDLRRMLRNAVTECARPGWRKDYLGESLDDAEEEYRECEAARAKKPLLPALR